MSVTDFQFAYLTDSRLAAHALSPNPVWLWSADATRILWANPVAAAVFDADSPGALAAISFAPDHAVAAQVARLAGTLPQGGAARLERLRGFGAGFGSTLTCLCSRIVLADNSPAVLMVSTERAGRALGLPNRAQRLLADFDRPAAIFTADGELIEAMPAASERFGDKLDLIALGAERLAREALLNGRAEGDIAASPVTVFRLGAGAAVALLVAFAVPEKAASPAAAAPDTHARRFPFRFVWQIDSADRFILEKDDFAQLLGRKTAAILGRPWTEIAAALQLDPQGTVASALAARSTWSGIVLPWPVDDTDEPLPIEMSGLPVFDRDRRFTGYRGFGICPRRRAVGGARAAPGAARASASADRGRSPNRRDQCIAARPAAGRRPPGAQRRRAQRL